jgi:hypothetical protein
LKAAIADEHKLVELLSGGAQPANLRTGQVRGGRGAASACFLARNSAKPLHFKALSWYSSKLDFENEEQG